MLPLPDLYYCKSNVAAIVKLFDLKTAENRAIGKLGLQKQDAYKDYVSITEGKLRTYRMVAQFEQDCVDKTARQMVILRKELRSKAPFKRKIGKKPARIQSSWLYIDERCFKDLVKFLHKNNVDGLIRDNRLLMREITGSSCLALNEIYNGTEEFDLQKIKFIEGEYNVFQPTMLEDHGSFKDCCLVSNMTIFFDRENNVFRTHTKFRFQPEHKGKWRTHDLKGTIAKTPTDALIFFDICTKDNMNRVTNAHIQNSDVNATYIDGWCNFNYDRRRYERRTIMLKVGNGSERLEPDYYQLNDPRMPGNYYTSALKHCDKNVRALLMHRPQTED